MDGFRKKVLTPSLSRRNVKQESPLAFLSPVNKQTFLTALHQVQCTSSSKFGAFFRVIFYFFLYLSQSSTPYTCEVRYDWRVPEKLVLSEDSGQRTPAPPPATR